MHKDVLLGAYVAGSTPAHATDARVKLVLLGAATVAAFGAGTPLAAGLVAAGLFVALAASKTPPRAVLAGLRPAAVVLIFSLAANAVVLVGQPGFSAAGLARGAAAVARIAAMVGFALVFSSTTMPPAIADALACLMSPLGRAGVPVGGIAAAVSVALRFVPLAAEEIDRIRCAQRARGARLDEGGPVRRLRGWSQALTPLMVGLFRRADELADAMRDRCFTGERPPEGAPLPARDVAVLVGGLAWALAAVLL